MADIAIVILNWNTRRLLEQYLPLVIEYSRAMATEIWVADNASSDGSLDMLLQKFPSVKTIALEKNFGFAGGYNRALGRIRAKYYMLLNSDVEVSEGWLDPLFIFMEANPAAASCMPKIRSFHDRSRFEYAGAAGGFLDYLGYPFCRGRIFDALEEDKGQYDELTEIFWATGACSLIRAEIFHRMGGFDELLFAHQEEIDLCWRMKRAGYSIWCCPQSTVYHIGGGTLPKSNPWKTYLNFRNNLILLFKNLPPHRLSKILLARLFLDGISGLRFLLRGDLSDMLAVIRAHFAFYGLMHNYREYRKQQVWKDEPSNVKGSYGKSIAWDFFIRKIRNFSELKGI